MKINMIGFLKGNIILKGKNFVLINVNNVGYKVNLSANLLTESDVGTETTFFIYTNVREDEISLYGFKNPSELNLFEKLISISGIGPRMGLDIIGSPSYLLQDALSQNDPKILTGIKGIGKKTAERILVELKNKLDLLDFNLSAPKENQKININADIITALEGLGYEKYQIIKNFRNLPSDIETEEAKIKWFLQNL